MSIIFWEVINEGMSNLLVIALVSTINNNNSYRCSNGHNFIHIPFDAKMCNYDKIIIIVE